MRTWTYMNIKGQGHSLTMVQRSLRFFIFKLFLRNRLANWNQISCGATMGWENKNLFKWSRSYDQYGCHAHMVKTVKNLLWNQKAVDFENWYAALGTWVLPNLFKWWPWVDLDLFYGKVKELLCLRRKFSLKHPVSWGRIFKWCRGLR